MKYLRVSIAATMGVVVYFGLAFAALKNPTPLLAEAWLTATLTVLAVVSTGAVVTQRRERRAFYGGAVVVAGWFLAFSLFPGVGPRLVTHRLVDRCYRNLSHTPTVIGGTLWVLWNDDYIECQLQRPLAGGTCDVLFNNRMGSSVAATTPANLRSISPVGFQQLCHSILAFPAAFVGGLLAILFAKRGETPCLNAERPQTT